MLNLTLNVEHYKYGVTVVPRILKNHAKVMESSRAFYYRELSDVLGAFIALASNYIMNLYTLCLPIPARRHQLPHHTSLTHFETGFSVPVVRIGKPVEAADNRIALVHNQILLMRGSLHNGQPALAAALIDLL